MENKTQDSQGRTFGEWPDVPPCSGASIVRKPDATGSDRDWWRFLFRGLCERSLEGDRFK